MSSSSSMDPLLADALSYATTHSVLMLTAPTPGLALTHAPFTVFPSPVDAGAFRQARQLASLFNTLVHSLSVDADFLIDTLHSAARSDADFTGVLLDIYKRTRAVTKDKPLLEILRADYFMCNGKIKQVEINTISASFGCLGTQTGRMHKYLAEAYPERQNAHGDLPENDVPAELAEAMKVAFHVADIGNQTLPRKVVFVIQGHEKNKFDQDSLRFLLQERYIISSVRMTLEDIHRYGSLVELPTDNDSNRGLLPDLVIDGFAEMDPFVAVIAYFRAGYDPADYFPTGNEWIARERIETSSCIPSPSVGVQLVGAKKIQQVLDRPGIVERYFNEEDSAKLRESFVRQWSLDTVDGGLEAVDMAVAEPHKFVLKPQREGGGNNLYGDDLKQKLQTMTREECEGFVLMERIEPDVVDNIIIREGVARPGPVVAELGIFGAIVKEAGPATPAMNSCLGHLLRSKFANVDDGGVAAGVAVLDSPLLVEPSE